MDLALDVRPDATTERRRLRARPRRRHAVLVGAAVAAAAAAGSAGVRANSPWFRSLDKPSWYPPQAAFPIVWTALYGAIAWSSTRALNRAPASRRADIATTLGTNLALNAGWTWAFFRAERPGLAVGEALALDASTISLIRTVGRHDRAAAAVLVPYLAWNVFATALTENIWFRNTP
ncbi:TspO/MBR family protein [Cellulomonas sp. ATA003]|uniref:TspO/MBR family protein n=1 Tax=Cellulomonas sp. ATA003 TaxID=3073064 RepID=UPI00287379AD|nr:TspO/MBR family protein [Cellulomonas sp. ATA003]WNB86284.1 TspO/MBR family protein [Cellulomonas sp. ATA003]